MSKKSNSKNKSLKRVIVGTGVLGAGVCVVLSVTYLLTRTLIKVALDRDGLDNIKQTPKTRKMILGFEEDEGFMKARSDFSEKLKMQENEIVEITSFDGIKLIGHWFPVEDAKRVIIAMHGWRSTWSEDFGMLSEFFQNNGCNVLYVEQRGQGNSGGEYMGFGLTERYDCLEWAKYISLICDLPVYLAGVSMGAATVLMASALDLPQNVRGIIADCGFTSPKSIWKHVANNNMKLAYGLIGKIADDMCKKRINIGANDYSATQALQENTIPVLFIHGTDDHFVPVTMTYENYKSCVAPKKIFVVPGADHAMSYYINPKEYEKNLLDFWDEFDDFVSC